MRVCVIGAGAIGGFIGVRLAHAGADVSVIARGVTAEALRARGWRLQSDAGIVTATVRVATDAAELAAQDLVIVAVKAPALAAVAASRRCSARNGRHDGMNGVPWWFFHGFGGVCGMRLESSIRTARSRGDPARQVIGCVVHAAARPSPACLHIRSATPHRRRAARRIARACDRRSCARRRTSMWKLSDLHPARHLVQAVGQHDDEPGLGADRRHAGDILDDPLVNASASA